MYLPKEITLIPLKFRLKIYMLKFLKGCWGRWEDKEKKGAPSSKQDLAKSIEHSKSFCGNVMIGY
jgi:hypothetical protein